MAKILLVDDAPDYCRELAHALRRDGHEVVTATNGRSAIQIGSRMRPDILVVDWMLEDALHGLNVAGALQIVKPECQSILISGFATQDLRHEAKTSAVFDFIEKPFFLEEIRETVKRAQLAPPAASGIEKNSEPAGKEEIGIIEVEQSGGIVFANSFAQSMISETKAGSFASTIFDVLGDRTSDVLAAAKNAWTKAHPLVSDEQVWLLRSKRGWERSESQIIAFFREQNSHLAENKSLQLLLEIDNKPSHKLSLDGHLLLVESSEELRRLSARVLRDTHCICHTAENYDEALRIFVHDPDVRYVIFDLALASQVEVKTFEELRPRARVLTSGDAKETLNPSETHLPRPWTVEQLLGLLSQSSLT